MGYEAQATQLATNAYGCQGAIAASNSVAAAGCCIHPTTSCNMQVHHNYVDPSLVRFAAAIHNSP
jgi:hypothetical protein